MRPFMPLSIPEVPSYTDFQALASLRGYNESREGDMIEDVKSRREWLSQVQTLLNNALPALKNARKEWDAISKMPTAKARTTYCEDWWRTDVKNVQRACIAANIAIETIGKVVRELKSRPPTNALNNVLKVEIIEQGKGYHPWWNVPKITVIP